MTRMKWLLLVGIVIAFFATPVIAGLVTKRYTIPNGQTLCVICEGERVGFWHAGGDPSFHILKCTRVLKGLRWGEDYPCSAEKHITLQTGQRLIVKPGKNSWMGLTGSYLSPRVIKIYNW